MSYAPASITALAAFWVAHGGINSGIVGGASHTRGYHLGKDRIFGTGGQRWADYSVKTARDKAGLSNAASALDLGRLAGSLPKLRTFSVWLVAQCRANKPGTSDIREVIYSPDGKRVYGYSREAGVASKPILGYGDQGHTWHTHISFYRDSEAHDKVALFSPYFEPAVPAPTPEADMPALATYLAGQVAVIKSADGANIRAAPQLAATKLRTVAAGANETWIVTGWVKGDLSDGSDQWLTRWAGGAWEYAHKSNVNSVAPVVVDCAPAVAAATSPLRTEIASLTARLTGTKAKVAALAADVADD